MKTGFYSRVYRIYRRRSKSQIDKHQHPPPPRRPPLPLIYLHVMVSVRLIVDCSSWNMYLTLHILSPFHWLKVYSNFQRFVLVSTDATISLCGFPIDIETQISLLLHITFDFNVQIIEASMEWAYIDWSTRI